MTIAGFDIVVAFGWAALLAGGYVGYRWLGLPSQWALLAAAAGLAWLSFALPNLTDGTPVTVGGHLGLAVFLLSAVSLLGAIVAFLGFLAVRSAEAGVDPAETGR